MQSLYVSDGRFDTYGWCESKKGEGMKNIRVLLADDEITILQGLKCIYDWNKNGFEIVGTAMDGMTALNLALELKPDLILIDINMPLMSGLDVADRISKVMPETLIVIISGYSDAHYMRRAIQYKVFDYVFKPVRTDDLESTLAKAQLQILSHMKQKEEDVPMQKEEKKVSAAQQMVKYINEHLSEEITLQMLADVFHMNASYVSQYFKKETGMNLTTYISRLRIQKAEHLLRTTEKSITEIAEAVGFHDYRFFSRSFKQMTGFTPSQFRAGNSI